MLQQNKLAWQKLLSFEENDTCVLTVILTRFCNLRCLHCNISEWLDNKTESLFDLNDFETFINRLKQRGKKKFFLNLIGGEVLTKFDRVQSFLNKFSEYQFGITTNLVKLPNDYQSLKNVRINVSLDGLPEDHDKIRGKGMFKKTYKNISILKKEDYKLGIQAAVDASYFTDQKVKLKKFYAMMAYLGLKREQIHVGLIVPTSPNIVEHPFFVERLNKNVPYERPCCSYRFMSNFVITPDGKLYNGYYNVPKNEFCLGTLTSSIENIRENYLKCLNNSHFSKDENCISCPALKICWGLYCFSSFKYDSKLKPSDLCNQQDIINKMNDESEHGNL